MCEQLTVYIGEARCFSSTNTSNSAVHEQSEIFCNEPLVIGRCFKWILGNRYWESVSFAFEDILIMAVVLSERDRDVSSLYGPDCKSDDEPQNMIFVRPAVLDPWCTLL